MAHPGAQGQKKTHQKPARKKIVLYFVPEKWRPLELLGGLLSTGATAGWMMGAKRLRYCDDPKATVKRRSANECLVFKRKFSPHQRTSCSKNKCSCSLFFFFFSFFKNLFLSDLLFEKELVENWFCGTLRADRLLDRQARGKGCFSPAKWPQPPAKPNS